MTPFTHSLRAVVSLTLSGFDTMIGRKKVTPFILCYHSISNNSWTHAVSADTFKAQMNSLKKYYTFVELEDIALSIQGKKSIPANSVAITFDDGYADIFAIKDFLKKLRVKPTVFILSNPTQADRKELDTNLPFLSSEQIQALLADGWTIGLHSATHTDFYTLTNEDIENQIVSAKQKIENTYKTTAHFFAYPRGRYTPAVISKVKEAGYTGAVSMDDGVINHKTNCFAIPRIGINNSHSLAEFQILNSPSVVALRTLLKKFIK